MKKSVQGFYVDIPDWDISIFRIFSWKFLEDFLKTKELSLVNPQLWDDPFELLAEWIVVENSDNPKQQQFPLAGKLPRIFAQSWSKTAHSDTLQRAYSRVEKDKSTGRNMLKYQEGVQIKTSPRKLMAVIERWANLDPETFVFLGAVKYGSRAEVAQNVVNLVGRAGINGLTDPKVSVNTLLMKREAFAHESEIRLIVTDKKLHRPAELLRIPVEPEALIDSVMIDPRLQPFERIERQQEIESWGYKGPFETSDLYQRTFLRVPVPGSWF